MGFAGSAKPAGGWDAATRGRGWARLAARIGRGGEHGKLFAQAFGTAFGTGRALPFGRAHQYFRILSTPFTM